MCVVGRGGVWGRGMCGRGGRCAGGGMFASILSFLLAEVSM